jgi:hypothetical protein
VRRWRLHFHFDQLASDEARVRSPDPHTSSLALLPFFLAPAPSALPSMARAGVKVAGFLHTRTTSVSLSKIWWLGMELRRRRAQDPAAPVEDPAASALWRLWHSGGPLAAGLTCFFVSFAVHARERCTRMAKPATTVSNGRAVRCFFALHGT